MRSKKALSEAIRICKDRNVLKEYLENRETEVVDIMITLYDEQEIMERYVESEVAEAVEQAVEQAVEKADSEAAIRTTIEMCQDFGISTEETVQKLIDKFSLSKEMAENKVQEYWK